MTRITSLRLVALVSVFIVVACGDSGDKIGTTIKGDRVPVMEETKSLQADKDLGGQKPMLPRMLVNLSWPQAGYDSEHAMPYAELSAHPQAVWSQSVGKGSSSDYKLLSHPVIDHGIVFTIDAQGLIRAIDAANGGVLWEHDTTPPEMEGGAIAGGLAVDGHTLYATTGFGEVYAFDTKTGAVSWQKPLLKPLRAAPTVADNRLYILSIDNELDALDAHNGNILWHQTGIAESATLMGASSPAVAGDNVVVAYNSGEIFALRAQNGRVTWNYSLASPAQAGAMPAIADIRGLPVIDHDRVYAISHSGRVASIEARSGDRVWEQDIGGVDTPIIAGDSVFVYGGDNQLMALARDSGRALWVVKLPKLSDPSDKDSDGIIWSGPILAGERLWMVNSLGRLTSFSPMDGAPVDSFDLGEPLYLSPIVADRTLYVLTDDGTLTALR